MSAPTAAVKIPRLPKRDAAAMESDLARSAANNRARAAGKGEDEATSFAARLAIAARVGALPEGLMTRGSLAATASSIDSNTALELVAVDVDLVDDNPLNARKVYEIERIAELATQLQGPKGQMVPAMAVRSLDQPGRFTLIDGGYRKRAILAAGLKKIRLELHPCPAFADFYTMSSDTNKSRTDQTAIDDALTYQQLLDEGVAENQDGLVTITRMSKQTISRTLKVLELAPEVIELVKTAPRRFSLRFLYALAQINGLGGGEAVHRFVDRALEGEVSHKELDAKIIELTNGVKQRKQRETSRQFLMGDAGKFGKSKVWDSGRMLIDIQVAKPETRDRIIQILQEELAVRAD